MMMLASSSEHMSVPAAIVGVAVRHGLSARLTGGSGLGRDVRWARAQPGILGAMSSELQARDPQFEERVRTSFAQQGLMSTFAAELNRVEPGLVEIIVPFAAGLTQQDGFFHAGVVIAAMDSACGYAAFTLMQPAVRVLTVELKVNLLSVASGDRLLARGQVIRPGNTLTVCRGDAYAGTGEGERHVATILTTMIGLGEA